MLGFALTVVCGATAAVAASHHGTKASTAGRLDQGFAKHGRLVVATSQPSDSPRSFSIGAGPPLAAVTAASGKLIASNGRLLLVFRPDGTPATRFGKNGRLRIQPPEGTEFRLGGVAVDPSGRVLVAGTATSTTIGSIPGPPLPGYSAGPPGPPPQWGVVFRYLPNGTVDPTFGEGGVVRSLFGQKPPTGPGPYANSSYETAVVGLTGIAVTPQGAIVVAGVSAKQVTACRSTAVKDLLSRSFVAKLSGDGVLDAGFGSSGVSTDAAIEAAFGPALDPSGGIAFGAGLEGACSFRPPLPGKIDHLLADGAFDPSFGSGGGLETPSLSIRALAYDRQGRLLVLGSVRLPSGEDEPRVLRLLPNGAPDPSFGRNGATTPVLPFEGDLTSIVADRRGRVLLGGSAASKGGAGTSFLLLRLSSAGKAEPKFGQGRWTKTSIAPLGKAQSSTVSLDGRGRIVLGGTVSSGLLKTGYGLAFARYLDGS